METQNTYKSFNNEKTIEELQYNMLKYKTTLESFIPEYSFFKYLLKSTIYKDNVINLFEVLEQYKNELTNLDKTTKNLIIDAKAHSNKITDKIECNDLACDNYFIEEYDKLEHKIHDSIIEHSVFKLKMFQYLQSVIRH